MNTHAHAREHTHRDCCHRLSTEAQTKGIIDDREDNFAIVFAAMGVSTCTPFHCCVEAS